MNKLKRVTVYLDADEYHQLKIKLVTLGKTVSGWLREVIRQFISTDKRL